MIDAVYSMPLDYAADILASLTDLRSEIAPAPIMEISFADEEDAVFSMLRWPMLLIREGVWIVSSDTSVLRWLNDNCPSARKQECVQLFFPDVDDRVRFEQALCEHTDGWEDA
jgi:hypothetical protein